MIELLMESGFRALLLGLGGGLALKLLRVKNPHIELTVWSVVLCVALAMPALMQLATITMTISAPQAVPAFIAAFDLTTPLKAGASLRAAHAATPAPGALAQIVIARTAVDWRGVATAVYVVIAASMLIKLLIGVSGTLRIAWRARRLDETWTAGYDVRVSDAISVPVVFGSTILLPTEFPAWDAITRQAALAHERSHVQRGDFYLLLAAEPHKAIFWFNPLAWWLRIRLVELAEAASDDAAIVQLGDRTSYAQVLINIAGRVGSLPVGVSMARPATVVGRIDRILRERVLAVRPSRRRLALIMLSLVPLILVASRLTINAHAEQPGSPSSDDTAQRLAEQRQPRTIVALDPTAFDKYVGYYQLESRFFTLTRDANHFFSQLSGQDRFEIYPESPTKFFYTVVAAQLSLMTDARGEATELVLHQNGVEQHAKRVDETVEKNCEEVRAAHIANKTPSLGTEESLRRFIDSMQKGQPNYDEMTPLLAATLRSQVSRTGPVMQGLGAMTSFTFRTVNEQGMDVYDGVFKKGKVAFFIAPLTPDGKAAVRYWRVQS